MPVLPNFFIVGAAKSGTSSLFHYLDSHPDVFMSRVKEPHYLCSDFFPDDFTGPGDEGFSENTCRNREDYLQLFESGASVPVRGEASVYYLLYPGVAERIHELNPDAKIVMVLRNPVDRAFSAYLHTTRDGRETLSFEDALAAEQSRRDQGYQPLWWYREAGLYSEQVKRYLKVFPDDQMRIFLYEDLQDTATVVREILTFLGVDTEVQIDTSIHHNASGVPKSRWLYQFFSDKHPVKEMLKPFFPKSIRHKLGEKAKSMVLEKTTMKPSTRRRLTEYFQPDIGRLEALIGRDLSPWLADYSRVGVR